MVNAVLEAYKAFLDEIHRDMSDDAMTLIEQARGLLLNDLQRQEQVYIKFRQESPLVARGTDEVNPLQDRLAAIESQRSELLIRRAELEGQLEAIQIAQASNKDDRYLLALVTNLRTQAATENAPSSVASTLNSQLVQLSDQEQQALEYFGPNHPHVASIRQRIASTRRMLAVPDNVLCKRGYSKSNRPKGRQRDPSVHGISPTGVGRTKDIGEAAGRFCTNENTTSRKSSADTNWKDESYRRNIDRHTATL